jgi:hypothetical protein
MQEIQEKEKPSYDTTKKTIRFARVRGVRKPYMTPTLTKLGDVVKLTNVSVSI